MSDASYDSRRHLGLAKEVVDNFFTSTLYCSNECCDEEGTIVMKCCIPEEDTGLGALKLISIIAACIAGLTIGILFVAWRVKKHNKKRRIIADVRSLTRSTGNPRMKFARKAARSKDVRKVRVGEYQKPSTNSNESRFKPQMNASHNGVGYTKKPALPSIDEQTRINNIPSNSSNSNKNPLLATAAGYGQNDTFHSRNAAETTHNAAQVSESIPTFTITPTSSNFISNTAHNSIQHLNRHIPINNTPPTSFLIPPQQNVSFYSYPGNPQTPKNTINTTSDLTPPKQTISSYSSPTSSFHPATLRADKPLNQGLSSPAVTIPAISTITQPVAMQSAYSQDPGIKNNVDPIYSSKWRNSYSYNSTEESSSQSQTDRPFTRIMSKQNDNLPKYSYSYNAKGNVMQTGSFNSSTKPASQLPENVQSYNTNENELKTKSMHSNRKPNINPQFDNTPEATSQPQTKTVNDTNSSICESNQPIPTSLSPKWLPAIVSNKNLSDITPTRTLDFSRTGMESYEDLSNSKTGLRSRARADKDDIESLIANLTGPKEMPNSINRYARN